MFLAGGNECEEAASQLRPRVGLPETGKEHGRQCRPPASAGNKILGSREGRQAFLPAASPALVHGLA
jgi:hypothetical protein